MGGGIIYFAFVFILVLILVLICVYRKRSEPERTEEGDLPEPIKGSLASVFTQKEVTVPSGQGTIYEYIRKEPVWICPDCDGENPRENQKCVICGYFAEIERR